MARMRDAHDADTSKRPPVLAAGHAYHEARRDALTQSTIRLRLMRRRLVRGSDPLSRARRQALDNELLARGYAE